MSTELPERAILDTSVVLATDIAPIPGVLAISTITLAELQFGVLVAKTAAVRAERLRRLSILQRRFDALSMRRSLSATATWHPRSSVPVASPDGGPWTF